MHERVVGGALVGLSLMLILSAMVVVSAGRPVAAQTAAETNVETEPPAALEPAKLQAAVDRLPDTGGKNAAQKLRSLLGPPDAFTVAFEPARGDSSSRREQWFYYDLSTVFEFVDGRLIWNLPLDAEIDFLLNASRYDPAIFEERSTWRTLAPQLTNPFSFEKTALDEEYGVPATIYAGDQLVLAFDDEGKLFYVEALPLMATTTP